MIMSIWCRASANSLIAIGSRSYLMTPLAPPCRCDLTHPATTVSQPTMSTKAAVAHPVHRERSPGNHQEFIRHEHDRRAKSHSVVVDVSYSNDSIVVRGVLKLKAC